jgi:hypothetical protein
MKISWKLWVKEGERRRIWVNVNNPPLPPPAFMKISRKLWMKEGERRGIWVNVLEALGEGR